MGRSKISGEDTKVYYAYICSYIHAATLIVAAALLTCAALHKKKMDNTTKFFLIIFPPKLAPKNCPYIMKDERFQLFLYCQRPDTICHFLTMFKNSVLLK